MLTPGERISHYRIVSVLGAGGMGEVYLARDTKLERRVAIKFLHSEFTKHEDALDRFVREAKAASALNHPNIITVYEIGEWEGAQFIAMEFVEGYSLRDLMQQRRLTLDESLAILIQSGTALAAAHAAGIVHRDVKPENIVRRTDGLVKVLDFGLAKRLVVSKEWRDDDSEASTRGIADTAPGFALGTTAYMSPEQARGKPVDARTDIWSLGVVVYEILAGRVPFPGETRSDMLAAILKSEPEPLPIRSPEIGRGFGHVVRKALGKGREERYQDIKDLILDLKILQGELNTSDLGEMPLAALVSSQVPMSTRSGPAHQTASHPSSRRYLPFLLTGFVAVALVSGWYLWQNSAATDNGSLQSVGSIQIASWKSELGESGSSRPRISPNGNIIAYVAPKDGRNAIWLKQIAGGEAFTRRQIDSSDDSPLWSRDGEQIAYFSERQGRRGIWVAPALGGDATILAQLDTRPRLINWSKDGLTIFFKKGQNLFGLKVASGAVDTLTNFEEAAEHSFSVSPEENRIAYTDRRDGRIDIWIAGLRGENPVRLTNDDAADSSPIWHPDGKRVIYNCNRDGIIQICVAYTDGSREPHQLGLSDTDTVVTDVSADGTKIVYTTSKDDADLWGVPVTGGNEFQITSDLGAEFWPDPSPNGELLVYQAIRRLSTGGKLFNSLLMTKGWQADARSVQITSDAFNGLWSPDASRIAFLRYQSGSNTLWITSADGGDSRKVSEDGIVFEGHSVLPYSRLGRDYQWSSDGRSLIYSARRGGVSNIWQASADGSGEKQLTRNDDSKLLFFGPAYGPDGNAIGWSAMTTGTPDARLWSIWTLVGETARMVYQSNSLSRLVGWLPSGKELIVKSTESKTEPLMPGTFSILKVDAASDRTENLYTLRDSYFQNVALSPDGSTLAFVTRLVSGDAVQIIRRGGSPPKTLASANDRSLFLSDPKFGPDGKIVYFGKQSNLQVISMINNFK